MISEKMRGYVENSSAIRAMFEEGKKMADQFGAENVYDFSLGNPNVPAPAEVKNAIEEILKNEDARMVHGYMNNAGYEDVREAETPEKEKRQCAEDPVGHAVAAGTDSRCGRRHECPDENPVKSGR